MKTMVLVRKTLRAFTLIELMIVVAILGILATVATSSYEKYKGRARQTEAKVNLANIHTAEKAFIAEHQSYTACLGSIGYTPERATRRYYTVGFHGMVAMGMNCGPLANRTCLSYSWDESGMVQAMCMNGNGRTRFHANSFTGTPQGSLQNMDLMMAGTALSATAFRAAAAGDVVDEPSLGGMTLDIWVIDHQKQLFNSISGL